MATYLYSMNPVSPRYNFYDIDDFVLLNSANTGNLMYVFSVFEILGNNVRNVKWGESTSNLDPVTDTLVLPLANHIGPHIDMAHHLEKIKQGSSPIVAIGLGAQQYLDQSTNKSIPEGTWRWLDHLVSRAPCDVPNIALRGEETFALMSEHGYAKNCIVTGCPSNFLSSINNLGSRIRSKIESKPFRNEYRIAATAGNPNLLAWKNLERSLIDLVDRYDGIYVIQHPINMLRLGFGRFNELDDGYLGYFRDYCAPKLTDGEIRSWIERYAHVFSYVPEWVQHMRHFDVVVGTRIHGTMAGIQAGVPSVCLYTDIRTRELCHTMKIPHADARDFVDGIKLHDILDILGSWDWRAYDINRSLLAKRLADFFEGNGLTEVEHLHRISMS